MLIFIYYFHFDLLIPHTYLKLLLINALYYSINRFKCHVCESSECKNNTSLGDYVCENAITCWKSTVRDSSGNERVSRGCTTKFEHLPLYCSQKDINAGPKKRDASALSGLGTYNIECCTGDFCNNGSFPSLPQFKTEVTTDNSTDDMFKLSLAIFGPVFIVGLFAIAIILCMRRNHKRRLIDARNSQDADIYYASDDLLKRSHACGDSTLRVSLLLIFIYFSLSDLMS